MNKLEYSYERSLAPRMAWLRFAEPMEVVSEVTGMRAGLSDLLRELIARGVVAELAGRYAVRWPYRLGMLDHELRKCSDEHHRRVLLHIVACFERLAANPETTFPTHYHLEADNP